MGPGGKGLAGVVCHSAAVHGQQGLLHQVVYVARVVRSETPAEIDDQPGVQQAQKLAPRLTVAGLGA